MRGSRRACFVIPLAGLIFDHGDEEMMGKKPDSMASKVIRTLLSAILALPDI
jgi:hypothetical protein